LIPLKDDIRSPRSPVATVVLILILIGLAASTWQPDLDAMPWPIAAVLASVLTAGIIQLAVNGLFLWLFGKSVEGAVGPVGLVAVYALGALAAAGAGAALSDWSVPAIGGAGAVAAVIAAHCVLFPRARIVTFVLIPFFFTFVHIPAFVLGGVWLLLQAWPAVGDTAGAGFPGDAGVSVAALGAGLAAGAVVAAVIRSRGLARLEPGRPAY
jgi:membrane associated rhomboid family serine protease